MQYMVGLGPIEEKSIKFFELKGMDNKEATSSAIKEYLNFFLDYNSEELEELKIIETNKSSKNKIIYCVFGRIKDVKEVHLRIAAM